MLIKKIFYVFATVTVFALLAMTGCHTHFQHGSHFSPEKRAAIIRKIISKKLDLNREQRRKLEEIQNEVMIKHKEIFNQKQEWFDKVLEQVTADKIDKQELTELFEKKHEEMASMQQFIIEQTVEFHSILTPEQKQKLANEIKIMQERHFSE
ncbi:Spy/CpxP family protein refolding chaperone [candidate division KSB1 bacterium]|nr:Spy/CpxP family protein refolding chaperone [candidate division KSB1 bacterium]